MSYIGSRCCNASFFVDESRVLRVYMLVLLVIGVAGFGFLMWSRSPMDAVNAEMAERVVTTRAALEEVPPRHPMLPRTRWREKRDPG
ncbi:MAG: hypothetical protein REJ24_20195 [Rhodocyclaceae bacterium]|nr:hypothetical protein [Pseudomonadota bacterium]MDQ7974911.1 hypothetical protein [Rhodocyclaceae bacterium]MDQ8000284.1 hypothetical protein [Pseudomonadota bacterium]MDQ8018037.1 hypothetical protein [Pseudomonadota bacterium]